MKRAVTKQIQLGLAFFVLLSCTHATPDWLANGTHAYLDKRAFYGVGTLSGIKVKNKVLADMTAESLAKGEVTRLFEAYSLALWQDYTASLTDDERAQVSEEDEMKRAFLTHVSMALFETVLKERWTDPAKMAHHALAVIKLKHLLRQVASAEDLSPDFRQFVKRNANDTFDRFKGLNEANAHAPEKSEGSAP